MSGLNEFSFWDNGGVVLYIEEFLGISSLKGFKYKGLDAISASEFLEAKPIKTMNSLKQSQIATLVELDCEDLAEKIQNLIRIYTVQEVLAVIEPIRQVPHPMDGPV
jgi:hypothetical protein